MKILYKNDKLEFTIVLINCVISFLVAGSFILLLGFRREILDPKVIHTIQITAFGWLIIEKIIRLINARHKKEYLRAIWFEFPLLGFMLIIFLTAERYSQHFEPAAIRLSAVWVYLVLQVVDKVCRLIVNMAGTGKNPTKTLLITFVGLILIGSGLLMLPKSYNCEQMSFVDALFTATSATCVTGLIVKDTGDDFTLVGQMIILAMIQLGGLGIMVFGAVFALLLRQAISVSESVAMQDVLSSETVGRISTLIGFIFATTVIIESVGAFLMYNMWSLPANQTGEMAIQHHQIFSSVFHSISAFCNAGFGLYSDSLISFSGTWEVYGVFCSLIIIGGLGFGVLYDIHLMVWDKIHKAFYKFRHPKKLLYAMPKRLSLQSKIVLSVSAFLIVAGTIMLIVFERVGGNADFGWRAGFFQSVTARTAGFNSVDIKSMTPTGRLILIILMFIGGSPGSTAGGIKTVTLCVVFMAAWATIRKRGEVDIFKRSIKQNIVGRAVAVVLIFSLILFTVTLLLVITEKNSNFELMDIMFESGSALGTVGLTTGITPALTTWGKLIIIFTMLIGRLGPLTLLAGLTFNLKPYKYSYPDEALIVG